MTEQKKPVEGLLDLFLYAPLGFAADARTLVPKLVDRGHDQVAMARVVGQFVVQQGQSEAAKQLTKVQAQAVGLLSELGLLSSESKADGPTPAAPAVSVVPEPAVTIDLPVEAASIPPASDLAVPEYDSLAASQVIPRLAGLTEAELELVRAYEATHRGRKTILNKIAQLQV